MARKTDQALVGREKVRWRMYPRRVRPEFREYLLERYPVLTRNGSRFYLEILQAVLYCVFEDEESGLPVLTAEMVALADGRMPNNGRVNAQERLEDFNREVFDLRLQGGNRETGARVVHAELDPELVDRFRAQEEAIFQNGSAGTVYLPSGKPVSRREQKRLLLERKEALEEKVADPPEDHPARELLLHLNGSSDILLHKYLRKNDPAVQEWVDARPQGPLRDYVLRLKTQNKPEEALLRYGWSDRTDRIFAQGPNVTGYPRDLRKIALSGTAYLDLAACQLAVVAHPKMYNCPELYRFLQDEKNFWREMLDYLGVDSEHKQLTKDATYGLTYGMLEWNFRRFLITGVHPDPKKQKKRVVKGQASSGLGVELTARCLKHPFMQELLEGRKRIFQRVEEEGGLYDLLGNWRPFQGEMHEKEIRAFVASMAQSAEVTLMLPILDVVQQTPGLEVIAFLHDGCHLHVGDTRRAKQQIERVCQAVDQRARQLGVPTRLTCEGWPLLA